MINAIIHESGKEHYLIEFVGEHAIEGWHKGCLTLELGKKQLFRIKQKKGQRPLSYHQFHVRVILKK